METSAKSLGAQAKALSAQAARLNAQDRLAQAVDHGPVALVSSFGAESVVLLHMLAQLDAAAPVLVLDTEMLFPETLRYQSELAEAFGLRNVQRITPDRDKTFLKDPDGLLHRTDTPSCCHLRKVQPLQEALAPYAGWITGRKRHQTTERAAMPFVENEAGKRLKFNPMADWTRANVAAYIESHALPRHPLVARGFASIGCAPCTHPVAPGQDSRAGRWKDQDTRECGIHIVNGRLVRATPEQELETSR